MAAEEPPGVAIWMTEEPCRQGSTHPIFLMHRNSLEGQYSEARTAEWGGPGTWKREVAGSIPGSRRSFWGHFFVNFGMSWDVSGSGLGMFLDGFGRVLEKMSDGVRKSKFSKMTGSIFPESGRFRIAFLTYPGQTNIKILEISILP